jgi:hypothetical protein
LLWLLVFGFWFFGFLVFWVFVFWLFVFARMAARECAPPFLTKPAFATNFGLDEKYLINGQKPRKRNDFGHYSILVPCFHSWKHLDKRVEMTDNNVAAQNSAMALERTFRAPQINYAFSTRVKRAERGCEEAHGRIEFRFQKLRICPSAEKHKHFRRKWPGIRAFGQKRRREDYDSKNNHGHLQA